MVKCEEGEYSWGGQVVCNECMEGWLCKNGIALPCATNGLVEENMNECLACPPGHECQNGIAHLCSPGSYSVGGNWKKNGKNCLNCEPGQWSGSGASKCEVCEVGKTSGFMRGGELGGCYDCPEGSTTFIAGTHPCVSLP